MAILIFERSAEISVRLADFIKETTRNKEVYYANSYVEAVSLLQEINARAVILDANFPTNQSMVLSGLIKKANPETMVIIMYTYSDETILDQFREIGADHLLNKYDDFEKIPALIIANQEKERKTGKKFNL